MLKLIILNIILISIAFIIAFLIKKLCKTDKQKAIVMLLSAIFTILCHYSYVIYLLIKEGTSVSYLTSNPNLILPIYPCNVVMWCCLIFGLLKNKDSKIGSFLCDYIYLIGFVCCLGGMFANVDFIKKPTLKDYQVTKSILAHGFMFLNVILMPIFGYYKFNFKKNTIHIILSVLLMGVIGLYINLIYTVLVSKESAYNVNSMFLIHSPFENIKFAIFPFIAIVVILLYTLSLYITYLIKLKKQTKSIELK